MTPLSIETDFRTALSNEGFTRSSADHTRALLGADAVADWAVFADSWNDLGLDGFMADGGRYRKRRFAAFDAAPGVVVRKSHQPHYQSRDYNALNGGVQRWFEPVLDSVADHPITRAVIDAGLALFHPITAMTPEGAPASWHVELHQFRIEALSGQEGLPTPEGAHRDGVDWVIVMLIDRVNVESGVTDIYAPDGSGLGAFTLTAPGDAVFLDDHRVMHGVTPIRPGDPTKPALRDVLVVTYRRDALA